MARDVMPVNEVRALINKYNNVKDLLELEPNKFLEDMVSSWINGPAVQTNTVASPTEIPSFITPPLRRGGVPINLGRAVDDMRVSSEEPTEDLSKALLSLSDAFTKVAVGAENPVKVYDNQQLWARKRVESETDLVDTLKGLDWNSTRYGQVDDKFIDMSTTLPAEVDEKLGEGKNIAPVPQTKKQAAAKKKPAPKKKK